MKIFKVKIFKETSTFNLEKENIHIGICIELPRVGNRFSLWKTSNYQILNLPPDFSSSVVKNIIASQNNITFITKSNSIYKLQILEETDHFPQELF